jgi:protein O-GlcNAc transferase
MTMVRNDYKLKVQLCLVLVLGTVGHATAQYENWRGTGILGVLPPAVLDKSPAVAQIRVQLSSLQVGKARGLAISLIHKEPANYEGYFWAGFADFQLGDYYAAVKHLRQGEKLRPAGNAVQKLLGLAYLELQQDVLFESEMRDASALEPSDFSPHYSLGRYLQSQQRQSQRAAQEFRLVLKLKPSHYEALYYLGLTREVEGDFSGAKRLYGHAIAAADQSNATFSLPYQGLSRLSRAQNNPEAALPFAMHATSLEPKLPDNQQELGTVYTVLGQVSKAVAAFKTSIGLDPTQSSAYYQLFYLYRRAGQTEAADQVLAEFGRVSACYEK